MFPFKIEISPSIINYFYPFKPLKILNYFIGYPMRLIWLTIILISWFFFTPSYEVVKIIILGQEYLVKTSANPIYFQKIADYVNSKTEEIISSGVDQKTQQLKIAVLACLNITDELFASKKHLNRTLDEIKSESQIILESINKKLK